MNPLGYRVSHFYHRALNPTTIPIIIVNQLFILTEQLSRHIADTKLSFLIPYTQINGGTWGCPEYSQSNIQFQPNDIQVQPYQMFNPMPGNIEQQLFLQRTHTQFVMDMMNANANQQIISQQPLNNGPTASKPYIFHDASTHTYDLMRDNDVEMKSEQ